MHMHAWAFWLHQICSRSMSTSRSVVGVSKSSCNCMNGGKMPSRIETLQTIVLLPL